MMMQIVHNRLFTSRSKTFDRIRRTDIGRKLVSNLLCDDFCSGKTFAFFQQDGTLDFNKQLVYNCCDRRNKNTRTNL